MTGPTLSRRRWLAGSGAVLSISFLPGCGSLPVIPKRPASDAKTALGWVSHQGGRYTVVVPRAEMGQNIATALKQVACDELGAPWEAVRVALHGTDTMTRVRATVGSESVRDFTVPLAQACASLRDALAAGQTAGRLELVERPLDQLRALRGSGTWVGQSPPLEQGLAIVTGQPLYASDVRLGGMIFGRVLRAPVPPELSSTPVKFNEAAAQRVAGFVSLMWHAALQQAGSQGIGILATTPGALARIEEALGIEWEIEGRADADAISQAVDIDLRLAGSPNRQHLVHQDTVPEEGPWDVDLRIDVPMATHAAIEPRAAVAAPRGQSGLELWVGSQDVFYQRDVVCRRLGLSEPEVVVHGCRIGGAFGGKTICTVELEAAVLARAAGRPVKVQWTREQEMRQAFHRPPSSHRVRARLAQGRLQHWRHDFASSHVLFTGAVVPAWLQKITDLIGDDGVARGAQVPYRAQAKQVGFDLVCLPVHTGPWRGSGAGPNALAIESAIDECARRAGADPVAFRLEHLESPRLRRVLERAAQTARPAANPAQAATGVRRGRGVACGIYKATSFAAVVADVEVDVATGEVRVLHLHGAHDCGRVIHPDQVRAQCEGNLVWGAGHGAGGVVVAFGQQLRRCAYSPHGAAAHTPASCWSKKAMPPRARVKP